jgi:glycine hydroxymethyltransferase
MSTILDSFRLDNKVALITGAASGLGAAIATALAQAGAQVAVHGNRRAAEETAESIGANAAAFQADLSHTASAESLFGRVIESIATREKPKAIIGGGSAYPRLWDFARMREIADKVGAVYVFDMAHIAGLVAGGAHPSPVPHAHITTTTTHKTLRGPRAGMILCGQELGAAVDKAVFPGQQGGPLMHIVAAKAVAFAEALQPEFKTYAAQTVANAKTLAATLQEAGFRIISGGTDNHLMLVDVFEKGILGSEAELALGKAGITVNKNAIPYDVNPPLKPSGIRVGTPALTTRGMKEPEMRQIGAWIGKALDQRNDEAALDKIRGEVAELANRFPLYAWRRAPVVVGA